MTLTRVPVPWRGMNLTTAPDMLPSGQGTLVRNLLPGRAGQLPPRGRVTPSTIAVPASNSFLGAWADLAGNILFSNGSTGSVKTTAGTVHALSNTGDNLDVDYAQMNGYVCGAINGAAPRGLMTWTPVGDTFVHLTNGPNGAASVCAHQSRLFTLGGTLPGGLPGGGSSLSDTRLCWTDPDPDLRTDDLNLWKNDGTGLVNQIILPATDSWVRLASFRGVMYVFGRNSILAVYGDTPATWVVRLVAHGGIRTPSTFAATDEGIYFVSTVGLSRFDGQQVRELGDPVLTDMTQIRWGDVSVLPCGYLSVIVDGHWLLYHERTDSFAELTSGVFPDCPSAHPGSVKNLPSRVFQSTATTWVALNTGDPGTSTPGKLCDVSALTTPELDWGTWSGAIIAPVDTPGVPIDAQAVSAHARLATPDRTAHIQRVYAEVSGGAWTATIEAEDGTELGTAELPGSATRQREGLDVLAERDIVRVRWTWTGYGLSAVPNATDAFVLAETAQRR